MSDPPLDVLGALGLLPPPAAPPIAGDDDVASADADAFVDPAVLLSDPVVPIPRADPAPPGAGESGAPKAAAEEEDDDEDEKEKAVAAGEDQDASPAEASVFPPGDGSDAGPPDPFGDGIFGPASSLLPDAHALSDEGSGPSDLLATDLLSADSLWDDDENDHAGEAARNSDAVATTSDAIAATSSRARSEGPTEAEAVIQRLLARPKPSRRWWAFAALVVAVAGLVAITLLPVYLLAEARETVATCFARVEGDPSLAARDCVPEANGTLRWPAEMPWFAAEDTQLRVDAAYRAAVLSFAEATVGTPRRDAETQAARKVLEVGRGVVAPQGLGPPSQVLVGAFAPWVEAALEADDRRMRTRGFFAARALGDVDALRRLSLGADERDHFALSLRRGAALCLLDQATAGREALLAADAAHRQMTDGHGGFGLARLGLAACRFEGHELDPRNLRPGLLPALAQVEASVNPAVGLDRMRSLLEARDVALAAEPRLRLAATLIGARDPGGLVQALSWLAPRHGPAAALDPLPFRSRGHLVDPRTPDHAVLPSPEAAVTGAQRLLDAVAARRADGDPDALECTGDECPTEAVLAAPDPFARRMATLMLLDAAREHVRRGAVEPAVEILRRVRPLVSPDTRAHLALLSLAADDADTTLELLPPETATADETEAAPSRLRFRHHLRAMALAEQGRFAEAFASAETAFGWARRAARDATRTADPTFEAQVHRTEDVAASAWLWAALGLRIDRGAEVGTALANDDDGAHTEALSPVKRWLRLALAPESERRPQRRDLALRNPPLGALAPAIYLAARAVPAEADAEVWLDRVLADLHRRAPVLAAGGRADAAAWRDDPEAAATWHARRDALLRPVTDVATATLAYLADWR
ncbi:MAG: hypothetical protein AAGN82_00505 [Myxococcota bacterium]